MNAWCPPHADSACTGTCRKRRPSSSHRAAESQPQAVSGRHGYRPAAQQAALTPICKVCLLKLRVQHSA
jgi:hypothetical protein